MAGKITVVGNDGFALLKALLGVSDRVGQARSRIEFLGNAAIVLKQGAGVDGGEFDRAHCSERVLHLAAP